jgi:hypothetical protein
MRQKGIIMMGVFDGGSVGAEVAAWFEARGLTLRISDVDYSNEVRSSPWGRRAPSRHHHVWVDLLALDGRMIQGGFGSGQSVAEAMLRARDRYRVEQGD